MAVHSPGAARQAGGELQVTLAQGQVGLGSAEMPKSTTQPSTPVSVRTCRMHSPPSQALHCKTSCWGWEGIQGLRESEGGGKRGCSGVVCQACNLLQEAWVAAVCSVSEKSCHAQIGRAAGTTAVCTHGGAGWMSAAVKGRTVRHGKRSYPSRNGDSRFNIQPGLPWSPSHPRLTRGAFGVRDGDAG